MCVYCKTFANEKPWNIVATNGTAQLNVEQIECNGTCYEHGNNSNNR